MIEFNGEYGCMGDLGMHACHVPFRAGWIPRNVRAVLAEHRPRTARRQGRHGPVRDLGQRDAAVRRGRPGQRQTFPADAQDAAHRPGREEHLVPRSPGHPGCRAVHHQESQAARAARIRRRRAGLGPDRHGPRDGLSSVTGGIFEFGFSDAILQMWAAFLYELVHGAPLCKFAGCATPAETTLSHRLFAAALRSQKEAAVVAV